MTTRNRRRTNQRGFVTVEMLIAIMFSTLFLGFLFHLMFLQYGRGVVRTAADEGARAGGQVTGTALERCEAVAASNLRIGLGGFAEEPVTTCTLSADGNTVVAEVEVTIREWLPAPITFEHTLTGRATSVKEGV